MKLTVIRNKMSTSATLGKLFIDNVFYCYTLEDIDRGLVANMSIEDIKSKKVKASTAIPRGNYEVIINHSDHFNRELPLLLNVPGYEGVRIHTGNTSLDTEGCILVGANKGNDTISDSHKAFDPLFARMQVAIKNNEKVTLEIL